MAAQLLRERGFGKVAVLDVDYHPGNGTQDIFIERGDVLTVALVVPLGVDTFQGDPISAFTLGEEHFPSIGARLAKAGLPTVLVQEGGYAVREIGTNVAGVVGAFDQAR